MPINRQAEGRRGEDAAVDYLAKKGYRIVERNFRFGRGEIDIVAEDGDTLVFVEVKARRTDTYGAPEDAVSMHKRRQLRRVAEGYLFKHGIEDKACRFDVVSVRRRGEETEIGHLVDAF